MDFIIYHSKDLDGKASGAIGELYFQKDNPKLIPYHYGEPLDIEQFKNKDVLMVDVTLSVESVIQLAQTCKTFTLVDHHISFYDHLLIYFTGLGNGVLISEFTGLIQNLVHANMNYYYSPKLSACEIMLQLFTIGNDSTQKNVRILGQYDTWRNTDEKKFSSDIAWDVVLAHQFGFRLADSISEVQLFLMTDFKQHVADGKNILKYQADQNKTAMQRSFEVEINGLKILACEGVQFNSNSFESVYNPDYHDAMMPFNYDGQQKIWNLSLYTTKDVDILSIAKQFGGGGHKQACGFQLPFDQLRIDKDKGLVFGVTVIMVDLAALPAGMNVDEFIKRMNEKATLKFEPIITSTGGGLNKGENFKKLFEAATPKIKEKLPPPPPVTEKIEGLTDTEGLDGIGAEPVKEIPKSETVVKKAAAAKTSNTKTKTNGNGKAK